MSKSITLRKVKNLECIAARAISVLIFSKTRLPDTQGVFERVISLRHFGPLPYSLCVGGPLSPCGMLGMRSDSRHWTDRGFSEGLGRLWSNLPHLRSEIKQILLFLRLPVPTHKGDYSVSQMPFSLSVHRGRVDFRQLATDLYFLMRTQEEIPWWVLFCSFLALELSAYFPQGMEARVGELESKGVVIQLANVAKRDSRCPYYASKDRAFFPGESRTSLCAALKRLEMDDRRAVRALLCRCWNGETPVVPEPLPLRYQTPIKALSSLRWESSYPSLPCVSKPLVLAVRGHKGEFSVTCILRDVQYCMSQFLGQVCSGPDPVEALVDFYKHARDNYLDTNTPSALLLLCQRVLDFVDLIYATWTHIEPVVDPDVIEQLRNYVEESEKLGSREGNA